MGQWNHFIVGGIHCKQGLLVDTSLGTPSICSPVPCRTNLNEKHPDGISVYRFKHESWTQFIRAMDDELVSNYFQVHNEYPRFGIVWLGTQILPVL